MLSKNTEKPNISKDSLLNFENVKFIWPNGKGLHNISFDLYSSEFMLVSGNSGAGKSTLLRLIVGLECVEGGTIFWNGIDYKEIDIIQLRSQIAFVHQKPIIIDGTVKDNLLLPFKLKVRAGEVIPSDEHMQEWLIKLSIDPDYLNRNAHELSIGQQQRICFIRAILTKPKLICLDEPTSSLDKESRNAVECVSEEIVQSGISVIMINHTSYVPKVKFKEFRIANGTGEMVL